jgi:hypothetical protein
MVTAFAFGQVLETGKVVLKQLALLQLCGCVARTEPGTATAMCVHNTDRRLLTHRCRLLEPARAVCGATLLCVSVCRVCSSYNSSLLMLPAS